MGEQPNAVTVRELLAWFETKRRGFYKVRQIRAALEHAGVTTTPDFEFEFIDAEIRFALSSDIPSVSSDAGFVDKVEILGNTVITGGVSGDPTYRIGALSAANQFLVTVKPDSSLQEATSLMLAHDYSQLPVMQSEFVLKGIVSWQSIGKRIALKAAGGLVRDFMDDGVVVASGASLFSVIETIARSQYVLVRNLATNKITGIVTTSDLTLQFRQLGEPFLLLGEIEHQIRALIDGVYTSQELRAVGDPSDSMRVISSVADLTFGEYVRLLEKPSNWGKLNLSFERAVFIARLDRVRLIRNDVVHFDPDPLDHKDLEELRLFSKFLQTLMMIGPTKSWVSS